MARTDVGGFYRLNEDYSWTWLAGGIGMARQLSPSTRLFISLHSPFCFSGGGGTQALALDPNDTTGQTFLAGTGNMPDNVTALPWQGAGIWRTTDGGQTYQRTLNATFAANAPWRQGGEAIAFDPTQSGRVWAGAHHGLFRSEQGGALGSWKAVELPADAFNTTQGGIAGVAVLPVDGDVRLHEHVLAYGPGFFLVSMNDGVTWTNISSSNISLGSLGCLRAVRCRNGTIFASVLRLDSPDNQHKTQGLGNTSLAETAANVGYRIDAGNWSDLSSYTWTGLTGAASSSLLPVGGGSLDLIELLDDEHTLVMAYSTNSFGVSRDGGQSFAVKATAQLQGAAAPKWWNPARELIAYGNGRLVADPFQAGQWIMGTGFYPARTAVRKV
jgi:hypothetical protein